MHCYYSEWESAGIKVDVNWLMVGVEVGLFFSENYF